MSPCYALVDDVAQGERGLATGAVSGLVVLDRDDYKGGADSLEELEHTYSPLPETVLALTGGGGVHYLFAHPGAHVKNGVERLRAWPRHPGRWRLYHRASKPARERQALRVGSPARA